MHRLVDFVPCESVEVQHGRSEYPRSSDTAGTPPPITAAAMSSAPPTSTYDAGAATLSVVCSWHAFFGRMVVSWCPGLGGVNAVTLKPVGWESIVCAKKRKKAAVYKTRRIMTRAGATGDAGGAAGGKARSTEA
jgi:hypothetical protein